VIIGRQISFIAVALALSVEARAADDVMGPVTGNKGIVTQGQVGNNYQMNLVGYLGSAVLKPQSADKCTPGEALVRVGNTTIYFSGERIAPVFVDAAPSVMLERHDNAIEVVGLNLYNKDGVQLAFADGPNHISYISAAHRPTVSASEFTMYDLHGDPFFSLRYTKECVLSVTGTFYSGKYKFDLLPDTILRDGKENYTAGNTIHDGGISFKSDGSILFGLFMRPGM
jgi:hypothetical protein